MDGTRICQATPKHSFLHTCYLKIVQGVIEELTLIPRDGGNIDL
jgi:hypothetical protein